MDVTKTGQRGFVFSFHEPFLTNVYVVMGDKATYICDTFLGPDPVEQILSWFNENGYDLKEFSVFYSHYHYDHVWGSCALGSSTVIAHEKCRELLLKYGESEMQEYGESMIGDAALVLPNATFTQRIELQYDNLTFWHTPGHTPDCSSMYDSEDAVLFVGDNVESPIPFLDTLDIDGHLKSLESYLEIDWHLLVASHDPPMKDDRLLKSNIHYLESFESSDADSSIEDKAALRRHAHNLVTLTRSKRIENLHLEATEYLIRAKDILASLPKDETVLRQLDMIEEMMDSQP